MELPFVLVNSRRDSARMFKSRPQLLQWLPAVLLAALHFHISLGEVGTAAKYSPPYIPTLCFGGDPSQIPSSNLFGAAGDGIWDNGASCGRQYLVRCVSASEENTCIPDQTVQITIINYVPGSETTMVLSDTAYAALVFSNSSVSFVNTEFLLA